MDLLRTRAGLTLAVLSLPCLALADVDNGYSQIKMLGRVAGTTAWQTSLEVPVSQTDYTANLEIAVVYTWTGVSGGVALAQCINSPSVFGWDPALDTATLLDRPEGTQHPDGRQGNFNFGTQRQVAYIDDFGWGSRLRIAGPFNANNNPNQGVSIRQNTPVALGTALDKSREVLGFRFDIRVGLDVAGGQTSRDLLADVLISEVTRFTAYNNPAGTSTVDLRFTAAFYETQQLPIHLVIPAPGAGAVVVGGLVFGVQRRRRA